MYKPQPRLRVVCRAARDTLKTTNGCSVVEFHVVQATSDRIWLRFQVVPPATDGDVVCDPVSSTANFIAKVGFAIHD